MNSQKIYDCFQSKSSFDLNVAACRVVLGILPGLEIQVLGDTEGLIKRLFDWATESKEPLQSYATGLLAVAMELQDIATVTEYRIINDKLIPIMIKRLKFLKKEKDDPKLKNPEFKRPFQMFSSNSPIKSPSRRLSSDHDEIVVSKSTERTLNPGKYE